MSDDTQAEVCEHGYGPGDGHHYWRCTGQAPPEDMAAIREAQADAEAYDAAQAPGDYSTAEDWRRYGETIDAVTVVAEALHRHEMDDPWGDEKCREPYTDDGRSCWRDYHERAEVAVRALAEQQTRTGKVTISAQEWREFQQLKNGPT